MFDTGNILYCDDFKFNNNDPSKAKYFIVLKRVNNKLVVGSLPTRKNKIPNFIDISHGCVNRNDRCFNCYLFEPQRSICDNGFSFPLPTFVYADEIDSYDVEIIDKNYQLGVNYRVEGKLTDKEFKDLLDCVVNSTAIKRGFKRMLSK